MILPSKTVLPVDSLISISSCIIEILHSNGMNVDELLMEVNKKYYKGISMRRLMLAINFLYITGRIKHTNGIISINI